MNQVRNLIKEGKLREGQTFHSGGELARMLGVSKMAVRQALQKLRSEGFLVVARGKSRSGASLGSYVAALAAGTIWLPDGFV